MRHLTSPLPATLAALAFALGGPPAQAGGPPSGGGGCNCLPATHTVTIPGISVTPPSVYIAPPYFSGVGSSGSGVNVDVSVQNNIDVSAAASGQTYAASTANAQAANLLAASGSVFVASEGGVSGSINNLTVVEQSAPQQCVAHASVYRAVAIQAVCLDDKAVPHPASQLSPARDIAAGYSGELFRCVAGSHMQYVTTAWTGAAQFDHGQTAVCGKGEALWRAADGHVQCRPQTPARDCNERSLLRRFGAGIKVVRMAADVCTAYGPGTGTVAAQSTGGDFTMDGGVGR